MIEQTAHFLERIIYRLSLIVNSVAMGIIIVMMLLTTTDVCLRYFLNKPLKGTYEVTELMLGAAILFMIAYTSREKAHIEVGLVMEHFSPRTQAVVSSITYFISIGLFAILTWASLLMARSSYAANIVSTLLCVPIFPFLLTVAFGSTVLCLLLLVRFLFCLGQAVKK